MVLPVALPVIGSVASSLVGGLLQKKGAKDANVASAGMAREQMAFEERMAGTAHQREVKDLEAAGLNPMLSGMGGAGAPSPSGAQGQVVNEMEGLGEEVGNAGHSASDAALRRRMAESELLNQQQQRILSRAQVEDTHASQYQKEALTQQVEKLTPHLVNSAQSAASSAAFALEGQKIDAASNKALAEAVDALGSKLGASGGYGDILTKLLRRFLK